MGPLSSTWCIYLPTRSSRMLDIAITTTSITTNIFSIKWHTILDTDMVYMGLTNKTTVRQTTHQGLHSR